MSRSRTVSLAMLAALCMTASGCGPSPLVRAGPATAAGSFKLETPVEWSRFGDAHVELWTRDGTLLNQLQFVGGVETGQHVFRTRRETRKRPDGAYFRSDMNGVELQALVLDGLTELGAVRPVASDLRPATFGDGESVRFGLTTTNQDGLDYRGMAQASVHGERLNVVLFLAPAEHYFERDRARVEAIFDTLKPLGR